MSARWGDADDGREAHGNNHVEKGKAIYKSSTRPCQLRFVGSASSERLAAPLMSQPGCLLPSSAVGAVTDALNVSSQGYTAGLKSL